jgi:hypothetical protein
MGYAIKKWILCGPSAAEISRQIVKLPLDFTGKTGILLLQTVNKLAVKLFIGGF